jgi:ketosteroid isomerase-like protein
MKEAIVAEHPNATRVMRGLEARARGTFDEADLAILNDVFDDNVTWHSTGRGAIQQDVVGKDAVLGAWQSVAEQSAGSFVLEPGTIYGDDLHVIGVSRISAKRGDRTLDMSEVEVFHMTPEGKISDFWGIAEDEDVLAAFWVD